jgi:hypothetical protein
MTEEQQEYITEAIDMLGKGYEPTIEIEAPRKVTTRRGGKLLEEDRPAFVKIYTDFKQELKDIKGDDLKVWLYLALSVNRFTDDARPGLRKIAEDTGLAVNTVQGCLDRLEESNLLDIERKDGKRNVYRPSDYVSAKKETVSNFDTVPQTVSKSEATVSNSNKTVSTQYRKTAQPEEPDTLTRERDLLDATIDFHIKPSAIKEAVKSYFKLTPNWETKFNREFLQWAIQENASPEQIQHAAQVWGRDKRFNWSHPNLKGIQEHWLKLIEDISPALMTNDDLDDLAARRAAADALFGVKV